MIRCLPKARLSALLTSFLFLLGLSGCSEQRSPDFQLHDGQQGYFADFHGKWLVINYWAVWCKPCIEEIPELNALAQSPDIVVLGVDFDGQQAEALQQAINKLAIEFPILLQDPASQLGYQRPSVLPTTVILNTEGKLHGTLLGPQTLHSVKAALSSPAQQ